MYRPLSPHVLIYKSQLSSILSILHRASGVIMVLGVLLVWVTSYLTLISPLRAHHMVYVWTAFTGTYLAWICITMLCLMGLSLLYHMLNGIRHFIWDFYSFRFLNKTAVIKSAYFILVVSVISFIVVLLAI